jgi:uncharacterized alpha-E superfamily protein
VHVRVCAYVCMCACVHVRARARACVRAALSRDCWEVLQVEKGVRQADQDQRTARNKAKKRLAVEALSKNTPDASPPGTRQSDP